MVIWCSNDYLGMGQHPEVLRGVGSKPPTRLRHRGGRDPQHLPAPIIRWWSWSASFADLHGKEAALVFTSGYVSNEDRHRDPSPG